MNFRLKFLFFVLGIFPFMLFAESPQLKSVTMTMEPMTAQMQRTDANGKVCGLVKVILPNPNVSFEGNVIGETEYKTSEYWCYLSPNTRFLKIKYPNLDPLMIDFTEFFTKGIQSKIIYEVSILVPHRIQSTGTPVRIGLSTQSDFWYGFAYDECKIRRALVKDVEYVDVYLNLKNEKYDSHQRVDKSNFKDCLLGDVHKGDRITVIPNGNAHVKKTVTVADSVINLKHLNIKIPRRGLNKQGTIVDKRTQSPIKDVDVSFYNLKTISTYDPDKFLYGSAKTDTTGRFIINNCFSYYIYNVRLSAAGYEYKSFDAIADTTEVKYELTPKSVEIKVFDGKKPIQGVKLICDNIDNNIFYSDDSGSIQLIGAKDNVFTISHPEYETVVVTRDWDNRMTLKLKKGNPTIIRHAKYDNHKDKLIFH